MAKKEEKSKVVVERTYNVPLRKEFRKSARWKRTKKAVTALREFLVKHMKSDNIIISRYVNQFLWKHGIKNPPHHVKVTAQKDNKGKVTVELTELPEKAKREIEKDRKLKEKKEDKEKAKKEEEAKVKEAEKKAEDAKKKAPETKEEKVKKEEKEEIKELKKEIPKQQMPKQPAIAKQVEQRPTAPKGQ